MLDRRQHFRRRTLLDGRLEIAKLNGWRLECSVRNLSAGGAKVALPGGVVVPQDVGLAVSDRPQRPARLVWYREGQAGFALVDQRGQDQAFTGPCRRAAEPTAPAAGDRLAARLAAIGEGRRLDDFTRP